jgi:ribonucleoside-diphosphate reductase alpha chain
MRDFLEIKDEEAWTTFKFENLYKLQMYNISVGITDDFLDAVKNDTLWPLVWKDKEWDLYDVEFKKASGTSKKMEVTADCDKTAIWKVKKKIPFPSAKDTFEVISKRKIKATEIWEKLCYNAWADGCPGLINLTTARKFHNLEYERPLTSANPCAEQMLGPYSSCNLSSIILSSFVKNKIFDFKAFKSTIHTAVRFADNVIDNCDFPIPEIKEIALKERRVGLGTMGVHDMLIAMELNYASKEGRAVVEEILIVLRDEAYRASVELAKEKGSFPFYKESYLQGAFIKTLPEDIQNSIAEYGIRNSLLLSQAPTGTISTLYNVSSGCEPWFSLSMQRNTRLGSYEDGCSAYIEWKNNHPNEKLPAYFTTSQDILPGDHIKMMLLFSKYIDSSVSKTINLSRSATVEDVSKAFMLAMENGAKGITIFRDGSKEGVLVDKNKALQESKKAIHTLQNIKEESVIDTRVLPKKRGNRALGATYRIHLQNHNLYITANRNTDGELVEIFATVGESKKPNPNHTSGVEDSWAEGLGKIISLALRAGVKPQSVIRNLKNIPSDKPIFTTIGENENSELIPSPPHAIGRVIEEELKYSVQAKKIDIVKALVHCSECNSFNVFQKTPTCYECQDCGYSGCG